MSWLYSRVLVEEYLDQNCLDGEQSVQSSGNPIQQAYCAPDKMMEFSRLSQFGMTYKLLMADRGEELLTLYLADFHAKTSVRQEKAQELMGHPLASGGKWHESFAKWDRNSSSWKTAQCLLPEDSRPYLETWPRWGSMRTGECWEHDKLGQTTKGTGFGSWPTPRTKGMCGGSGSWELLKKNVGIEQARLMGAGNGGKLNPTWVEWLMGWPLGWTDLKPLEMDKSHCVLQPHGKFSQEDK